MKKITKYAIKAKLRGCRKLKHAENSTDLKPVFFPRRTLSVVVTTRCRAGCPYCSNLIFPNANEQFKYTEIDPEMFGLTLNRFYGMKYIYLGGGECPMISNFETLIQNMQYFNINIMTNLSEPSVENILKIGKTTNNITLDITYHFHSMEFREFVVRYNKLKNYTKSVHIINADGNSVDDTIGFLANYGIPARWTKLFTDNGIFERKPKTVYCKPTNYQIMPDGSIHPCRSRAHRKCEPIATMFDATIDFNTRLKCEFHGWCGPCDIDRDVETIHTLSGTGESSLRECAQEKTVSDAF